MPGRPTLPLGARRFRSHPGVAALRTDELPTADRSGLEPGHYGLLRSVHDGGVRMAVDPGTAALFLSLRDPVRGAGCLPRTPAAIRDTLLARLVCDGVLQVERDDGVYADGCDALETLFGAPSGSPSDASHPLARLSLAALEHAALIPGLDVSAVATRLYRSNAHPRTAAWSARLPHAAAVEAWLGLASDRPWVRMLGAAYEAHEVAPADPWRRWRLRTASPAGVPRHKVYVSPPPAELPEVFARVASLACALRVPAFKVGRDVAGVLRPDKLVLYFGDEAAQRGVAAELDLALRGGGAQGVPFTEPVDDAGLLSRAVDPADSSPAGRSAGRGSWREWITRHLGNVLRHAAGDGDPGRRVALALRRVALEGVDTSRWCLREAA